jgi:hypothetical protein
MNAWTPLSAAQLFDASYAQSLTGRREHSIRGVGSSDLEDIM